MRDVTETQSGRDSGRAGSSLLLPLAPRQSWIERHWPKVVAGGLWLLLLGAYVWWSRHHQLGPVQSGQWLIEWMQSHAYAPALYLLVYALRPVLFFPSSVLSVAGGFLFGPVFGMLLTVVAANTSALVGYVLGRYFGEGIVNFREAGGMLQRYVGRMQANSFETILVLRFTFLPYDLVNYVAGLLRIDWRTFLLATALGSVPGTISFVLFGASIERFDGGIPALNPWVLALGLGIFVISLALSRWFKRRERSG